MKGRCLMALLAVLLVISLAPVPAAGQAQSAEPDAADQPRTAWGDPDLQGVWDFRTITPMERPDELAGKEFLTDAEAAELEEGRRAENAARDDQIPEDIVGNYNTFWFDRGTTVIGTRRTSLVVDPPDGRVPPLTPEAERKRTATEEARKGVGPHEPTPGGWVEDLGSNGLQARCILGFNSGPPMTPGGYNNNVQLLQTPEYVALLNEMNHDVRIIPMDRRPHLPEHIAQWRGDSRGHWEGDTLVVETTNFLRETSFMRGGSSANLHLVERFTRVSADRLMYEATVEDPTTWTRPWTFAIPMKKNPEPVYEYACHEGNYGLYNILAGARAEEKAAAEAAKKGSK